MGPSGGILPVGDGRARGRYQFGAKEPDVEADPGASSSGECRPSRFQREVSTPGNVVVLSCAPAVSPPLAGMCVYLRTRGKPMDVQAPRCAGLDAHKRTVVACVRVTTATGEVQQEVRTFGTMCVFPSAKNLASWAGVCPGNK
jgi:hypothetical protein